MSDTTNPTEPGDAKRWRGHTHRELYQMLHDGPGATASAEPARRWQEISTNLSEIGQDLQKALEQTGSGWTGRAAGRAYDRLSVTAAWATEASASAAEMRAAIENQAEHIARARADMPAPEDVPATQPDPTVAPAAQVAQTQTDLEAPEAAASSAEERAFEVMAAYEQNTSTNTSAMADFDPPPELIKREEVRQGGGFNLGQETAPSGVGGGGGRHALRDDHRPRWSHAGGGGNGWTHTSGSSMGWGETSRGPVAQTSAGPAGPGSYYGGMPASQRRDSDQSRSNRLVGGVSGNSPGAGSGSGGVSAGSPSPGSTQPRAGMGMGAAAGLPHDMQAAAASQAAAAAHQAGAPVAPAGGPAGAGQQERMAMRRFGMEAIGSNQWFGDTDEPVVGQSQRRRRDFRETEEVTESVSILDEEHRLPPNVIGDGSTGR